MALDSLCSYDLSQAKPVLKVHGSNLSRLVNLLSPTILNCGSESWFLGFKYGLIMPAPSMRGALLAVYVGSLSK